MNIEEFSKQLAECRHDSHETVDDRLQDECIAVLGSMERILDRIDECTASKRRYVALEAGKEVLVEMIDFVTGRFGKEAAEEEFARVCDLREMVNDVQALVRPNLFTKLFGVTDSSEDLRHQAYRQVGDEFVSLYRALLSIVDRNFNSHERANEWRSSCRIFIDDFRRRW